MENAFEEFPKIARLNRTCLITEKIDGTNAQILIERMLDYPTGVRAAMTPAGNETAVVITEPGVAAYSVYAGSRSRWIKPGEDNFGFAAWVNRHALGLVKILGEGRHYGEWWGAGIQRRYGLNEKYLSLFHTLRWRETIATQGEVPNIGVVPILYEGLFTTDAVKEAVERLRAQGSAAAPGFMKPEGVVVYHNAAAVGFKVTLEKDEQPKSASNADAA